MKTWKIILIIAFSIIGLGIIGLVIANCNGYRPKAKNDFKLEILGDADTEDVSDKYEIQKYDIKLTNKIDEEKKDENYNQIYAIISCKFDELEATHDFVMNFDKNTNELVNEQAILDAINYMNMDLFDDLVPEVIEKCKNEKLYNYTSLNMNYKSSKMISK